MAHSLTVGGLEWAWIDEPDQWEVGPADELRVWTPPATRWFVDPRDPSDAGTRAPALLAPIAGQFQLRAVVELRGHAVFDAGALAVYAGERSWAKLCVENAPTGAPMVVSVVTRGVSDDCNSFALGAGRSEISLRVSRVGTAYAFHASRNGEAWELIRYFGFDAVEPVTVGFQAQSPRGNGAEVRFRDITLVPEPLVDIRNGT